MAARAIDFQSPYSRKQIAIWAVIGVAFCGVMGASMAWQAHKDAERWRIWNESGDEALLRNLARTTPPELYGTIQYRNLSNGQPDEIIVGYDRERHAVCAVAYLPAKIKGASKVKRGCVPDPQ